MFASGRKGWWKEQMLVDRSLRTMAGLTSLFALIMAIICFKYLPQLAERPNQSSTSVGVSKYWSLTHFSATKQLFF